MIRPTRIRALSAIAGVFASLLVALVFAVPAQAGPVWEIHGHHGPSTFQAGGPGEYAFYVNNVGDAKATGPVSVEVRLPEGVKTRMRMVAAFVNQTWFGHSFGSWSCPSVVGASSLVCEWARDEGDNGLDDILPGSQWPSRLIVYVDVDPGATGPLVAEATVSGGGAEAVSVAEAAPVGAETTEFGVVPGSFVADSFDRDGKTDRRAGGHPFRAVSGFDFNVKSEFAANGNIPSFTTETPDPVGTLKSLVATLPRGFVGNPQVVGECTSTQLRTISDAGSACPANSQIGTVELISRNPGGWWDPPSVYVTPVYNMVPPKGVVAAFSFQAVGQLVQVMGSLDPKDYSIVATASNINETLPVHGQRLNLWGVPGDPAHDDARWNREDPNRVQDDHWGAQFTGDVRPFLTLPSECGVDDTTQLLVKSWQGASDPLAAAADAGERLNSAPQSVLGCASQAFEASLKAAPDTTQPDAAAGLGVSLDLAQDENPVGRGTSPLKDAVVELAEGLTINPAAADGLAACTDDQLRLGTNLGLNPGEPSCPDASKVGTVTAVSPALEDPIEGGVYIRSQNSDDPASGEMFRLALVVKSEERGVIVKLPGSVSADPQTGRLVTRFKDNPQLPVSKISLRLKGGQRAPLATPPTCGEKSFTGTLSSWGGQVSDQSGQFAISCPASNVLSPSFAAASTDPRAGVFSPFTVNIARSDGQAYLNGLSMDLAPGMLAKLKGLPVCSDAAAAAGSCAASSRVGTATVGAGSGSPFYLKGGVYLTGPYKGAPYGLAVKVRAAAGPFDLGDVIVRQALHVDRTDGHVTVVSDPLPTIVKGVPVRLRSIDVDIDRPGFTSTPTSCAAKDVASTLGSPDGRRVSLRSPYRVGECARLDLKPNLALTLSGKGQTTDGKHPAITANVTQKPGQANLKKVRVALPLSLALDPDNANGLCEFVDGSKPTPTCPKASIVGTATAVTPILDEPLTGPVYFVKNVRKDAKTGREIKTLPKLVIPLVGQNGIKLTLTGTSNVVDDQLVTTFDNIPDAPVSSFKLNINGGKSGILVVSGEKADICKSTQIADQQIDGQNNKNADASISIQTPSCPLKVLSKKIGKSSVAIKVGGLGAGKVTVTGRGIRKTTKTITKSTVATITAKRTKGTPVKVKVSFLPTGAKKAKSASATLR